MFGAKLDYLLLKPLADSTRRATEEELDREGCSAVTPEQVDHKLPRILERFDGRFPISGSLRYLDMGCGSGELTLGLARMGVKSIVGVDVLPRFIELAKANARAEGDPPGVQFVCEDLHKWKPPHLFDVAFSFDALEHIPNPMAFLERMATFLAPGGIAVVSFGPLFHSPFGDHMYDFFKVQIPWRGALFSEEAMIRIRREFYRPTDPATRYSEIAGGLNLMRYSEFIDYAKRTGWRFRYQRTNAFLRNPLLRKLNDTAMKTPLRDYFVHNVYAVLERAPVEAVRPTPVRQPAKREAEEMAA